MERCGHYRRWRDDFALVKDLNIEYLRYGPPYYRVHCGPDRYDWSFADDTFHARLFLTAGDRTLEIDSRPSDALALAVRAGARIYAEPAVLERAGVSPDSAAEDGSEEDSEELAGSPLERPPRVGADRVVDPRLDIFRDFVNSLGTDGEAEGSGE